MGLRLSAILALVLCVCLVVAALLKAYEPVMEKRDLCESKGGVMVTNTKCAQEIKL
jgi:hypothetical protein